VNEKALAKPGPRPTCLLCGTLGDLEPHLGPGRFRCQVCRSMNDRDLAIWPDSGSLVLPPVPKPRFLSASARATKLASGSPFRRDGGELRTRIVLRWWVKPHWPYFFMLCVLLSGPFFSLFGRGLDLMGWIFSGCFYVLAYVLAATWVERATLVVENGLAELVLRRLPMPRWRRLDLLGRPSRSVIRWAGPEHVYFRRRVSDGQENQKDPECYYDILVLDEAGRLQIIGGFSDVNEARFVYQVLTGLVSVPEVSSPLALDAPDETES
jgi:hypothetical protein